VVNAMGSADPLQVDDAFLKQGAYLGSSAIQS
jgi:hypothetical protein